MPPSHRPLASLIGTFNLLTNFGHDSPIEMAAAGTAAQDGEPDEEDDQEAMSDTAEASDVDVSQSQAEIGQEGRRVPQRAGSLYIEARLHPFDVEVLLKAAPSEEVAQAWREGIVAPRFRHRVKLVSHERYADDDTGMELLYDEGRRFWEQG